MTPHIPHCRHVSILTRTFSSPHSRFTVHLADLFPLSSDFQHVYYSPHTFSSPLYASLSSSELIFLPQRAFHTSNSYLHLFSSTFMSYSCQWFTQSSRFTAFPYSCLLSSTLTVSTAHKSTRIYTQQSPHTAHPHHCSSTYGHSTSTVHKGIRFPSTVSPSTQSPHFGPKEAWTKIELILTRLG